MPPQTTSSATTATAPVSFADLEKSVAAAAVIGAQLVADKYHGASQFAAAIRSALDHASQLIALQKQWIADNPPETPSPGDK